MTSIRVVKFKKVWWHNCLPRWREVRKREVRCALLDERSHRRGRGRSKSPQQIRNSAWRSLIVQKIIFARLFLYLKSLKTPTQSVEELNVLKKNVVGGRRVEKIKKIASLSFWNWLCRFLIFLSSSAPATSEKFDDIIDRKVRWVRRPPTTEWTKEKFLIHFWTVILHWDEKLSSILAWHFWCLNQVDFMSMMSSHYSHHPDQMAC